MVKAGIIARSSGVAQGIGLNYTTLFMRKTGQPKQVF
jgi:predicted phosphoribosyltransferase